MLADDVGMNVLRIDVEVPREQRAKAGRIERRSGTDHLRRRHAKFHREMRGHVRHDIDGIADHQQHGLGRVPKHGGDDLPEHVSIAVQKFKPCLARLLRHAAGDYHDTSPGQIRIVARSHGKRMRKRDRMENIVRFRFGAERDSNQ